MGSLHIVENEVPTHIHADDSAASAEEITEMADTNNDGAAEIKQDKQKETDNEEAS